MDKYTVVNPDDGIVFIIKLSNHSNTQRILKYLLLNERSHVLYDSSYMIFCFGKGKSRDNKKISGWPGVQEHGNCKELESRIAKEFYGFGY